MAMKNNRITWNLHPGDVIATNKSFLGRIEHVGLYVGHGRVIDNHPDRGVSEISIEEFLDGGSIKRVEKSTVNHYQTEVTIDRAFAMIGKSYHLIKFNCEHFINEIRGFGKKSDQLSSYGRLLLIVLVIFGLIKVSK